MILELKFQGENLKTHFSFILSATFKDKEPLSQNIVFLVIGFIKYLIFLLYEGKFFQKWCIPWSLASIHSKEPGWFGSHTMDGRTSGNGCEV